MQWRRSLQVGDRVAVCFQGNRLEVMAVTSAPATFITVGKYANKMSFSRLTGKMTGGKPMGTLFRIEQP